MPVLVLWLSGLQRHFRSVSALCLLKDGRLASASEEDATWLWDVATGTKDPRALVGHARSVRALCLLQDGRLALGTYDKKIRLWDVKTGAMTNRVLRPADTVIALCPDQEWTALALVFLQDDPIVGHRDGLPRSCASKHIQQS